MSASTARHDADERLRAVRDALRAYATDGTAGPVPVAGRDDLLDEVAAATNRVGERVTALREAVEARVAQRTRQLRADNERLTAERAEHRTVEQLHQRNREALERRVADLERLQGQDAELATLSSLLQSCRTVDEFVSETTALGTGFGTTSGSIYRSTSPREQLAVLLRWGTEADAPDEIAAEDCWCLRRGRLHVSGEHGDGPRCRHLRDRSGGYCIPLVAHGDTLGFLNLADDDARRDDSRRLRVLGATAEQIALALANLELRSRLEAESIRDPLTGLFNRRYFVETLRRELRRADRASAPVAVLVADVDHFKRFNDRHGHAAGDAALRAIASTLTEHAREEDIVCRYGGEELTVVMADTAMPAAMKRADSLVTAVRDGAVSWRGQSLPHVTVSVGVAVFPEHGRDVETLFEAADAALYEAKRTGRDRAVAAD